MTKATIPEAPTGGRWAATPLRRCGCDWPYDWVSDVTSYDPATGIHQQVAMIRQSAARPYLEASANVRAMSVAHEMAGVIHAVGAVIDMTDPDHASFVDSGADCLEVLLRLQPTVLRLRRALTQRLSGSTASAAHAHTHCHHE